MNSVNRLSKLSDSMAFVIDDMERLVRLDYGWDGYRGRPVSLMLAHYSIQMLMTLLPGNFLVPSVVPGSLGTVQFEWHLHKCDIEILVHAPYEISYYIRIGEEEYEGDASDNLKTLQELVERAFDAEFVTTPH